MLTEFVLLKGFPVAVLSHVSLHAYRTGALELASGP